MMTFDSIAENLLKESGYRILKCQSDEEAIDKSENLKNGSNLYPVHFTVSDTSGEKPFEEFYTDTEIVDMDRFQSLGVIINEKKRDKDKLLRLLADLGNLFRGQEVEKEEVVQVIKGYLPNFNHIEAGKSLDSKM